MSRVTAENVSGVVEEFRAAGLGGGAVNGHHEALCPRCDGVVKIASTTGGGVGYDCDKGCTRSQIADALHFRRTAAATDPAHLALAAVPDTAVEEPHPHLRRLDVAAMLTTPPEPVDWLVEGVVARGTLTMLAGREKQGKSLLALALAARVASGGGTLAGIPTHAGRVLVVDAENGEREIHRRLRSLGLASSEHVAVCEAAGLDLKRHLPELDAVLADVRPDLVILDSWRSLWTGDENDASEVSAVLDPLRNLLRRHDAGTVLIHHMGKGAGGYRGSTAAGASVENVLELARHDDDEDRRRRRLRNPSCRYEQEADERWLRIEADREQGLLLIGEADPYKPGPGGQQDTLRAELEDELGDAPRTVATLARAVGRDPRNRTVRVALEALATANVAEKVSGGWIGCRPEVSRGSRHFDTLPANDRPEPRTEGVAGVSPDTRFEPNGGQLCGDCGAALTAFAGRLYCHGCTTRGEAA